MLKLKQIFLGLKTWILAGGVFFLLAPSWMPHIPQIPGRNLFVTADSLVLLGVTLLVSFSAAYLLPDSILGFIERAKKSQLGSFFCGEKQDELRMAGKNTSLSSTGYKLLAVVCGLSSVVLLVFILYWVNRHILHSFLSSADEHSCFFLAECLRKGKLYVDIPPLADFFKVVHVGMRDGKWFSVYPPGWPLIWAFGIRFNMVDWLNPVMSALAVLFFYLSGKRLLGRLSTVVGLLFCCLNPFFLFTAASYFSHGTCLLMISVFLYSFLRWREAYEAGQDPIGWASLCGVAVGYGLMTRYLTMAVVAGPFLLYHYLSIFFSWGGWRQAEFLKIRLPVPCVVLKRPQLRKSDWIAIGIMAFFMVLILWQNYRVTGKIFKAPNKYDKSWERLGFRSNYMPFDAFFYLVARIFYLMDWFAPAIVIAYLFLICSLRGFKGALNSAASSRTILRNLFRLGMVFIAFGYFFYYSWGGNQWGPRYLWEGMPFLCMAVIDWIACRWKSGGGRARKFLLVFVIMSLVTSGLIFIRQAEDVAVSSRQRRALYDLADQTLKKPSIVFIHGFLGDRLVLSEDDAVRNSPFLDGRILYAHDLGDRNKDLMAAYPGREYFRGTYDRQQKKAVLTPLGMLGSRTL